ncbi:MAG: YycH family regulatory protein [Paenisporosarcina sp.]
MGMKYVEHVKSAFLLFLVGLSMTLTFSIWTYTPTYDKMQKAPAMDISIAESKRLDDVVKPYKMLFSFENGLTGTSTAFDVERILGVMKEWEFRELTMINNNLSPAELNEYSKAHNRFTIFYPTDIPFPVFDNIMPFSSTKIQETGFDRIIVDWNFTADGDITVYFASSSTNLLYAAKANKVGNQKIEDKIIKPAMNFSKYEEIQRQDKLSLFVPSKEVEIIRYTYILKEIPPVQFKDALFDNPNKVRRSSTGSFNEEYSDDTALMNVDLLDRTFKYSYPAAESSIPGIPSEIFFDSLDFVNEHDGWTDDYRFVGLEPINQGINYQLYLQGYPVFSEMSSTTINTFWGNDQIYKYVRPYYTLDLDLSLPSETEVMILPSGKQAENMLAQVSKLDVSSVKEITVGYYLTRDDEKGLLHLEPSWFYLTDKVWTRITPETLGGGKFGLE